MSDLGTTPKKSNENEILPLLILNSGIQIEDSKKFKKNIKNHYTADMITKKINCFYNKMKSKTHKEKHPEGYKINSKIKIKSTNNFITFLHYKLKRKYDSKINTYNVKKINELIFNIPSKFTASFKDYLLIEEDAEFLKREYHNEEFKKKFKKIFYFYEKYSKTFPNYTILNEGKYMYRNILRKQKMIDELQKIKEEEEEKINSKLMDISNDTIFTNNTIESIINQKDSFWINNLEDIMHLDQNQNESNIFEHINLIIKRINQFENIDKTNKQTIYKKEFKKIRNLSKPLYINQINPKLVQIKEKINQIKNYRNNFELNKKLKNNKTIESSYNSFSTTINNKSFNNKGILINNKTNIYEEKKDILKKKIPCPKDSSYKKGNKDMDIEKLNNVSNKHQNNINENNQNDSKFSNSMITNKIKNYFKININNYDKRKQILNSQKKSEYSYNIGSLFNSRKDRCKEFLTDKKLMTVFNKYINNKTKPFKKNSYLNTESVISQHSIKNDYYIITSHYNINPKINNKELFDSKRSYDDNNINKSKKTNNYSLNKNNINISQNSFLNNTFSSLKKNNKSDFNKRNNKKFKKKNIDNLNRNKLFLKSKILKNKNKSDYKKISFTNNNNKVKNLGDKNNLNHLKTFYNKRSKTNFINNNNTNSLIGNQSSINQRKTNNYGKKIILSGNHYGRNEKFLNLKYACGNTFNNNKSNRKKILLNK